MGEPVSQLTEKRMNTRQLEKQADKLLGLKDKRITRRGNKKKPTWVLQRKKAKEEEMKKYKSQRQERWKQYQEFKRKILD